MGHESLVYPVEIVRLAISMKLSSPKQITAGKSLPCTPIDCGTITGIRMEGDGAFNHQHELMRESPNQRPSIYPVTFLSHGYIL